MFFREPQHFVYLTDQALPAIRKRADGERLRVRVWCAGCSSGQEVYTLAMVLDDYAQRTPGFSFEIIATDISSRMLQAAERAIYDESLIAPVPLPLRKAYLLRSKDASRRVVRMAPQLRRHVQFAQLNFMDDHYRIKGPFDGIFFRNVMIYFERETQERVVQRQCRLLRPHGYLFISHTESLAGLDVPLGVVANAVYRKKP